MSASIFTVSGKKCSLVKRTASASSPPSAVQTTSPQIVSSPPQAQAQPSPSSSPQQSPESQDLSSLPSSIGAILSASKVLSSVGTFPTSVETSSRSQPISTAPSIVPVAIPDTSTNSTTSVTGIVPLPNTTLSASSAQSSKSSRVGSPGSSPSGNSNQSGNGTPQSDGHGNSKVGMAAGIASGMILLALLVALIWCLMKRRKPRRDRDSMASALIGPEKSHFEHGTTAIGDALSSKISSKFNEFKDSVLAAREYFSNRVREAKDKSTEIPYKSEIVVLPNDIESQEKSPSANPVSSRQVRQPPPLATKTSLRTRASKLIANAPQAPFSSSHPITGSFDQRDRFRQAPPLDAQPTLPRATLLMQGACHKDDPFQDPPEPRSQHPNPFADPPLDQSWPFVAPSSHPPSRTESPKPHSRPISALTAQESHLASTSSPQNPATTSHSAHSLPNPFSDHSSHHSAISSASSDLFDHWRRDTSPSRTTTKDPHERDTVLTYDTINTVRSDPFDLETPDVTRSLALESITSHRPSLQKVDTIKSVRLRSEDQGRRSSEIFTPRVVESERKSGFYR